MLVEVDAMRQWCCSSCRWWPRFVVLEIMIRRTSWDGYKLVMAAMQHGNVTVGTTLNEGLPLKLVRSNVYTCFLIIRIIIISITGKYNCLIDLWVRISKCVPIDKYHVFVL